VSSVPLEATPRILLWIGVIMTAQAFEAVPRRHSLAVAFGLVPALAAWADLLITTTAMTTFNVSHAAIVFLPWSSRLKGS
jgi:AGZA family xanthine/uracil permease-like MFS transporter